MRRIDTGSFVRATRSTSRDINRRIILNLVREHEPLSRAELARRMGIGRGMITSLVSELIDEGAVYTGATIEAPRGRRPEMLYVRTRDRLVIAIDVRLSKTFVMLSDFGGRQRVVESFETIVEPEALADELAERIAAMLAKHDAADDCEGIGLVVPGMVDRATGRVLNAPQLGWHDVEIRDRLASATGLPVEIENAPIACALARMWLNGGNDRAPQNFVYVTVSDGVGAAVVVRGEVVRGSGETAGEFGHVPLNLDGPECLCGGRGCLEAYTSNLATISRYLERGFSPEDARTLVASTGVTIGDVLDRWNAGDERATNALRETARYLGAGLSMIVNSVNPAMIFVGGEITAAWELFAPAIATAIESRALTANAARTPVVPEAPGSFPRLQGATALIAAAPFAAPIIA
jgi:N-acetylglucosamine repressor